jgi:serine phosphatase RsbU (regulator of sigma subunit)
VSAYSPIGANAAIEWDLVIAPMPGETVIGDRAVVMFGHDHVLAAAIDGVGHGADAAAAAHVASYALEHAAARDIAGIVRECHEALAQTRGAAMSLARLDCRKHTMTWLGIGNVEARLLRGHQPVPATESLLLHGGIIGHSLPRLAPQTIRVSRGDLLIFATDGIRRDFADCLAPSGSCHEIAERVLQRYWLGSDDALVLVARYLGRT